MADFFLLIMIFGQPSKDRYDPWICNILSIICGIHNITFL